MFGQATGNRNPSQLTHKVNHRRQQPSGAQSLIGARQCTKHFPAQCCFPSPVYSMSGWTLSCPRQQLWWGQSWKPGFSDHHSPRMPSKSFLFNNLVLAIYFFLFYHFYIYLHVHTLFGPPTPSHLPTPASWKNLFCPLFLWFCWRENIRDNKKDIALLLVWGEDCYTEILSVIAMHMCITTHIGSSLPDFFTTS
jgi:hypothetical protein